MAYSVQRSWRYARSREVDQRWSRQLFILIFSSICLDLSVEKFPGRERVPQSFPEASPVDGPIVLLTTGVRVFT